MKGINFLLYVVLIGLIINLIANMIWKYIPVSNKHIDKIVTAVLMVVCVILIILFNYKKDDKEGEVAFEPSKITPTIENGNNVVIIDQNNGNVFIENIQGDKVIAEDNMNNIKEPIFSKIDIHIPYGYFMKGIYRDEEIYVYAQPISEKEGLPNPHSQDIVINFNITNQNEFDIKIDCFYIEVLDFFKLNNITVMPVMSAGDTRAARGCLSPESCSVPLHLTTLQGVCRKSIDDA